MFAYNPVSINSRVVLPSCYRLTQASVVVVVVVVVVAVVVNGKRNGRQSNPRPLSFEFRCLKEVSSQQLTANAFIVSMITGVVGSVPQRSRPGVDTCG